MALWQGGLAALALILALALPGVSRISWAGRELALQAGFVLILALVGGLGGAVFAGSAALWGQTRPDAGVRGGVLYAADLLGATGGSLGISLVVLPVWGLGPTLYLVAVLHAGAALMLARSRI